jgi:hypothetical protein
MSTTTTPKGYTYPNGDDPVSAGDDVIKGLALKLEATAPHAWTAGALNTSALAAGAGVGVAMTWPAGRFNVSPMVAVSHDSSGYTFAAAAGVTASGCTLRAFNPGGSATSGTGTIRYIAVQMTPTSGAG